MTATEAAQLLGVSNRTIHRWCAQRMIHATRDQSRPGARHGKPLVITADALLTALNDCRHSHMRAVVGKQRALGVWATQQAASGAAGDVTCTCEPECPYSCKGECGCIACHDGYQDFLSVE